MKANAQRLLADVKAQLLQFNISNNRADFKSIIVY